MNMSTRGAHGESGREVCAARRATARTHRAQELTAPSVARRQKGEPNCFIRSYYACVRASLECYLSKRARVKPSTNIASSCCGEGCAEKRPA